MIYTDLKQAIGSVLLDVKYYVNRNPVDSECDFYEWDVQIFNSGIICLERECYDYDGCRERYVKESNEYMPEELKELIEKHMESS